jgi:GT2 family glycosyltransferase
VADNNSSDGSPELIKKTFGERVSVVEMGRNAGFAAANNAGLLKACGKYVLFLNPDTVVLEGALQTLLGYMEKHPEAGACGGNLYSPEGNPAFSYWMVLPGVRFEWNRLFSDLFLRLRYKGSQEHNYTGQVMPVAHVMGADLMVKKAVLDEVGGMDDSFFLFYEETELCYRIARAGYTIVNIPEAHIVHAEGHTIDTLHQRLPYMMASRAIYLCKCVSPLERRIANAILWLSCVLREGWFTLRCDEAKKNYWKYTRTHIGS